MNKIYIAGSDGMIGSQLMSSLKSIYTVVGTEYNDLDLLDYEAVYNYVSLQSPDLIILTAAKVGGGHAISSNPIGFYEENIMIQTNIMRAASACNVKRVILLASAAIYPAEIDGIISEELLMSGPLDSVQESYALAKLSGVFQARYYNKQNDMKFITVVPANLIANRDNGQVVFSLLKQMNAAKNDNLDTVTLWGSGNQRREFVFIQDVIDALSILIANYDTLEYDIYNIGRKEDISIRDLAFMIREITQYEGEILFDATKPEGVAHRLLDSTRLGNLGYSPKGDLSVGIANIYKDVFGGK